MSRGATAALDFLPFAKLTQANLAPRVRHLVEGSYQVCWPLLEPLLGKALEALDAELFKLADQARSSNEQQSYFDSLREYRNRRSDFVRGFRDTLQRCMLALVDPTVRDESLRAAQRSTADTVELSLIDPADLEEDLVLSEIAAKAETRANRQLLALAYRYAVISGRPPMELEALPLGPHKLCACARAASRCFDVVLAHRILFYRHLDRAVFGNPLPLFEAVNTYLIEHQVLANLNIAGLARPRAETSEEVSAPEAHVTEAEPAPLSPEPPSTATLSERSVMGGQDSDFARLMPELPAASQQAATDSAVDSQFFETLRELLAGRRKDSASGMDSQRPVAQTEDVQAVLTVLQAQPSAPVMVSGKWTNRRVTHIKQDLLNQLRGLSGGAPAQLREEDSDTIDLVGYLFDHLMADYRPNSVSHGLMSRLQVPLLKVALQDKSFFTRRSHPARQLLNMIAETSAFWIEDEEQDRPVIEKLQVVVDRVSREFDNDVGVFDNVFEDLSKHLGGLRKKADVAEKRHVEAAKGREKLELARAAAQEAVQQRMFDSEPPEAVRTLLESAWSDAIALALLRQGVDSPKTRERLAVVDQLLALFKADPNRPNPQARLEELRPALEDGLAAIGFHEDAIGKTWDDVSRLLEQPQNAAADVQTTIAEIVRLQPRLGADSATHAPVPVVQESDQKSANQGPENAAETGPGSSILHALRKPEKLPLGEREIAMIERIKRLPFGTWFEFAVNQQGEKVRRKLCWFSPVTGRCLFINARGVKSEERMIEQLARDMVRGNAAVVTEQHEGLIDRAWNGIVSMLKGLAPGREPPPLPSQP